MTDPQTATPSGKALARSLGVPFDGRCGTNNAITDVPGVAVGYSTIIRGEGPLVVGVGPVRTGVTAILPRGHDDLTIPVFSGCFSLNGAGEMTGSLWIEESGQCEGPITITNTHSCGIARDATIRWIVDHHLTELTDSWGLPVAAETYDGDLNDINGFHVTAEHVFEAIESARTGPIELGSIGGGTGMICYDFKGGSGSASRIVGDYTVGVFVQANFGIRSELVIAGVPVGRHISGGELRGTPHGSVIAIVATDAPLMPHQLKRLARRVSLGVGRSGSIVHNGSGDIFLAFSTANKPAWADGSDARDCAFLPHHALDPLFAAVVEATDEAIIESIVVNEPMTGRDDLTVMALPHDRLVEILSLHNRLSKSS